MIKLTHTLTHTLTVILKKFQPGHKYLFSEITHNWFDARGECELYGGWLVQINDLAEYNCIMRHGVKEGLDDIYFTDGNDIENTGVWTHAYDSSAMSFFPPRVRCSCIDSQPGCSTGGDVFFLYIWQDRHFRGNYCDVSSESYTAKFICEAEM